MKRIEPLAARAAAAVGCELVLVELTGPGGRTVLRVTIDKEGGVGLMDCQQVSEQLSVILDLEDPIAGSYQLEVSSPGLDRPLIKPEDYQRFRGQRAWIRTYAPIDGRRQFRGRLEGLEGDQVRMSLADQGSVSIPLAQVAKARLEAELGAAFKPARH